MLRGLMLRKRAVLGTPKCEKSVGRRGSAPDPAGGAYSAPPDSLAGGEGLREGLCCLSPRTPLKILSLCLFCVYIHTCMKMLCYFLRLWRQSPKTATVPEFGDSHRKRTATVAEFEVMEFALKPGRPIYRVEPRHHADVSFLLSQ